MALSYPTRPGDIDHLIADDHAVVERQFQHLEAGRRPLNRPLLSWMALHAFRGLPEAATDPRIALLDWTPEQSAVMPPTLVVTDERDVLRSQGQQFAQDLEAAGVETTHRCFPGVVHEFFRASAVLDEAEQAQQDAAAHFQAAFDRPAPAAV
ncbi:alpha/beta hydrolase fold domain-containing protein [Modestobacter italicus]|uniref:alpha/beta hydrolase fold domain-containing protein n=1 Tax=Modestobacter italicus (strain DSM 44449 / CECT 9708 / BC 501) TaxID=2732864 RepID=UPI0027DEB912|nr:alpha/beta hydrolase fold domain-containing protein [Modestobacter italicus]